MKADLIIYNARQLVTCASDGKPKKGAQMRELGIVENGAVVVNENKIVAVGKSDEILREYEGETMLDADGKVICPGFVECHTHLVFAGNRLDEFELKIKGADYLEILKSGGGILSTVKATRQANLEKLIEDAQRRLDKLLALGVTTCEIKTGYGLTTESELKILKAVLELDKIHPVDLIPTILAAHAVPSEFKNNPDSYVDLICNVILHLATVPLFENWKVQKEIQKTPSGIAKSLKFNLKKNPSEFWNLLESDRKVFVDVFCEKKRFQS